MYHSARTARDRDRIRQSVLEGLGWRIYRIWSTDWFRDPDRELKRAVAAIERAKAEPVVDRARPRSTQTFTLHRSDEPAQDPVPVQATQYVCASLKGHRQPLHEVSWHLLAQDITRVVQVESPVHVDEAARRILDASGVGRLGSRIREAMKHAITEAISGGDIEQRGNFLYSRGQQLADVPVRDRSALSSGSRKFEYIAPEEVRAAIAQVISSSFGIATKDLPVEVCRMFGFGQTSEDMRVSVESALSDMLTAGTVGEREGMLTLTPLHATDYDAHVM